MRWSDRAAAAYGRRVLELAGVPRSHNVTRVTVDLEAGLVQWVNTLEGVSTLHGSRIGSPALRHALELAVEATRKDRPCRSRP